MYPTNLHGNSVYIPKAIHGVIKNEVAPTKTSPGSFLETQIVRRTSKRSAAVWPLHLETALIEGKIPTTIWNYALTV
jgi:hypothetical protein